MRLDSAKCLVGEFVTPVSPLSSTYIKYTIGKYGTEQASLSQSDAGSYGDLGGDFATGSGSRTRTYDPRINSPLLYQLSYAGVLAARRAGDDSKASSTPSTWGQTEGACGVFRESGG